MTNLRAIAVLAVLPLLAACGGDGAGGAGAGGCAITYSGAVSESVWCDAPALRTNGSGGYVLWVMAFRGTAASFDQAGQVTLVLDERPAAGVDYGFAGAIESGASGFAVRTEASDTTHEARTVGALGAVTVRFTSVPATDGPDPDGFDGIGVVHGTIAATLVSTNGGGAVALQGSF